MEKSGSMPKIIEAPKREKAKELLTRPVLEAHKPVETMQNLGLALKTTSDYTGNIANADLNLQLAKKSDGLNQNLPGDFLKVLEGLK